MRYIKLEDFKIGFTLLAFLVLAGCDRELSDDAVEAGFSQNGDVFIDTFSSGLDYFPFVGEGADPNAFSVDTEDVYSGTASMRFDVPAFGDGFVGATFNTTVPRDLTGYDALTFYAKASQAATINEIGFGINGETNNKYQVSLSSLAISTNWQKYTIPIPDPSKLTEEVGLLWLAEGAVNEADEGGYIFWLDEVKFEKLGTIGSPIPALYDGEDIEAQSFIGTSGFVNVRSATFNLASGENVSVVPAPSYFDFISSDPNVVAIEEFGNLAVIGDGTAVITATLANVQAEGSLTIEVLGGFEPAPTPPARDPDDVISIFSDAYTNEPVDYYNGYFAPFQTTQGQNDIFVDSDNVISYTDLNFVGIGTFVDVPPINANDMTHLHVDINVREAVQSGDFIRLELINNVGGLETSGSYTINDAQLPSEEWISLDIPLDDFTGLTVRNQLGLIFFISDATISNIYVDNVYYYRE